MENASYLFAAFAIVWAVLFIYIFSLARRQKKLRQEIDSLTAQEIDLLKKTPKKTRSVKKQKETLTVETEEFQSED